MLADIKAEDVILALGNHKGLVFTTALREEAEQFIAKWHYSGSLNLCIHRAFTMRKPGGLFGDRGDIIACCVFAHPVNRNAKPGQIELVRLARIEPKPEDFSLSWLVGRSLRWLRINTDYKMVISYADNTHDHHGGIYQATNFYFVGTSQAGVQGFRNPKDGKTLHKKTAYEYEGTSSTKRWVDELGWEPVMTKRKNLYVYPLVKGPKKKEAMIAELGYEIQPYPKPDVEKEEAAIVENSRPGVPQSTLRKKEVTP